MGTYNTYVKFGLKIPNPFGKNVRKKSGRGIFLTHTVHTDVIIVVDTSSTHSHWQIVYQWSFH